MWCYLIYTMKDSLRGTKNKTKNWEGEDVIDGRNCMKRMWIWKALEHGYNLVSDKGLLDC